MPGTCLETEQPCVRANSAMWAVWGPLKLGLCIWCKARTEHVFCLGYFYWILLICLFLISLKLAQCEKLYLAGCYRVLAYLPPILGWYFLGPWVELVLWLCNNTNTAHLAKEEHGICKNGGLKMMFHIFRRIFQCSVSPCFTFCFIWIPWFISCLIKIALNRRWKSAYFFENPIFSTGSDMFTFYLLVNEHRYGESACATGTSTINDPFW